MAFLWASLLWFSSSITLGRSGSSRPSTIMGMWRTPPDEVVDSDLLPFPEGTWWTADVKRGWVALTSAATGGAELARNTRCRLLPAAGFDRVGKSPVALLAAGLWTRGASARHGESLLPALPAEFICVYFRATNQKSVNGFKWMDGWMDGYWPARGYCRCSSCFRRCDRCR